MARFDERPNSDGGVKPIATTPAVTGRSECGTWRKRMAWTGTARCVSPAAHRPAVESPWQARGVLARRSGTRPSTRSVVSYQDVMLTAASRKHVPLLYFRCEVVAHRSAGQPRLSHKFYKAGPRDPRASATADAAAGRASWPGPDGLAPGTMRRRVSRCRSLVLVGRSRNLASASCGLTPRRRDRAPRPKGRSLPAGSTGCGHPSRTSALGSSIIPSPRRLPC